MDVTEIKNVHTRHGSAMIIGVSHLSDRSTALVAEMITKRKPDAVILELDAMRAAALHIIPHSKETGKVDNSIEEAYPPSICPPVYPGLTGFLWATAATTSALLYAGMMPHKQYGNEQAVAAEAARRVGAKLVLADRPISLTLARIGRQASVKDCWYMMPSVIAGIALQPNFSPSSWNIIRCLYYGSMQQYDKLADVLRDIELESHASDVVFSSSSVGRYFTMLNTLLIKGVRTGSLNRQEREQLSEVLEHAMDAIDVADIAHVPPALGVERDKLLGHAIYNTKASKIIAVVGKAHVDGIARFTAEDGMELRDASHYDELLRPYNLHSVYTTWVPAVTTVTTIAGAYKLFKHRPRWFAASVGLVCVVGFSAYSALQGIAHVHKRLRAAATGP